MNYLAHLFLAEDDHTAQIGNLMGDFCKGVPLEGLPAKVVESVGLHRAIDRFTDSHLSFRRSRARLREPFRHYSGILVDLFYDHFLATQFERFATVSLREFADRIYRVLDSPPSWSSPALRAAAPRMIAGDLLVAYAELEHLPRILDGIQRRAPRAPRLAPAVDRLRENYAEFEQDFVAFWPELVHFVRRLDSSNAPFALVSDR